MKLNPEFYKNDTHTVAKGLLGKVLCREQDGILLKGRICEVESYLGTIDRACHAYNGKRGKKNESLYCDGGTMYVYFIYGMYYCFNVVTRSKEFPEAVLIRGLVPLEGTELLCLNRYNKNSQDVSKKQLENLCNGPGKLCKAFNITKEQDGLNLFGEKIYII